MKKITVNEQGQRYNLDEPASSPLPTAPSIA